MTADPAIEPMAQDGADLSFICGALRSGTTLLRIMVNHHPQLSNPGEMDFLFETPPQKNGAPDLDRYLHELSFNRVFQKLGFQPTPGQSHRELIRELVRQLARPGQTLSINVHRNFSRIPDFFPQARFIHLVRDPRDVARSAIGMGWAGNVYFGVDHWIASERDFEKLAARLPPGRILRLRNEDLIAEPVVELTRLCAYFGVGYDPAMLDYPASTTYAAPDPALIAQWRRQLSPRDVGLIEGKAGAMLVARGYQLSGHDPVIPGPAAHRALRVQDRWARWRFAARRQGALLTLADMIARRLPPSPLSDFTRRLRAKRASRFLQ